MYREIKNNKNFKKIDDSTFSLIDYDNINLVLEKEDIITTKDILSAIRIGQNKFREKLLKKIKHCPITGINDNRILVASHIKP
ncbi:MAG: hypothetical protein QM532_04325 [Cyanobium sp. MAG06]|nr:hypothetical protein [Cyanobium sp. MAG06]